MESPQQEIGTIRRAFHAIEALESTSIALGWDAEYRQLSAGPMVAGVAVSAVAELALHFQWATTQIEIQCATPNSLHPLIINAGGNPFFINGELVASGHAFLGSRAQHCDVDCSPGTTGLTVFLPERMVRQLECPFTGRVVAFDPHRTQALISTASRILSHVDGPSDLAFEADLDSMLATLGTPPRKDPVSESRRRVRHAREWIHGNLGEPFTVETLRSELGVSPRTLQRDFQRTLGLSPHEYVRSRRMELARRRLQRANQTGEPVSVSDVALDSGFRHLGRFAAEFRTHFGILPSALKSRIGIDERR